MSEETKTPTPATKSELESSALLGADSSQEFHDSLLFLMASFASEGKLDPKDVAKIFAKEAIGALEAYRWMPGDMAAAHKALKSAHEFLS